MRGGSVLLGRRWGWGREGRVGGPRLGREHVGPSRGRLCPRLGPPRGFRTQPRPSAPSPGATHAPSAPCEPTMKPNLSMRRSAKPLASESEPRELSSSAAAASGPGARLSRVPDRLPSAAGACGPFSPRLFAIPAAPAASAPAATSATSAASASGPPPTPPTPRPRAAPIGRRKARGGALGPLGSFPPRPMGAVDPRARPPPLDWRQPTRREGAGQPSPGAHPPGLSINRAYLKELPGPFRLSQPACHRQTPLSQKLRKCAGDSASAS